MDVFYLKLRRSVSILIFPLIRLKSEPVELKILVHGVPFSHMHFKEFFVKVILPEINVICQVVIFG